ncbi:MAG: HEAT repeat domain-containing protein [Deltaproteobacteria bacterium]|nr:HEAT repeat domain-containing protein [Deltaproteobacteria bacterium]
MENIKEVMSRLNSEDKALRHETVELLGESRSKDAIKPLAGLLKEEDPGLRDAAVNALINIGGSDVADAVIPFLYEGEDASMRNMAVEILERLGEGAKEAVIALFKEKDEDVLRFAVDIIGNIGSKDVYNELIPLLSHHNPNIRASAANTISKLKFFDAAQNLVDMLKDDDEWVRFSALEALGSLGTPDILDRLLDAVQQDDMSRIAALDAISNLAEPADCKKVMPVISSSEVALVISAETAAKLVERFDGLMHDAHKKVFLKIFTARLNEGDILEKRESLRGITLLKDKGAAADVLLQFAARIEVSDEETVSLLRHAMAAVCDSSVIVDALKKGYRNISVFAEALGDIGDQSSFEHLKSIIENVDREAKKALLGTLEKIEAASSFDTLANAMQDKDGHVRKVAARILGNMKDKMAVPLLFNALLNEPYKDVQEALGEALFCYSGDDVEGLLIKLLNNEKTSLKIIAVRGLGKLKTDNSRNALIQAVKRSEPDIRSEAVKSLGRFEADDITGIVSKFLKDESKTVRLSALEVMRTRDQECRFIIDAADDEDMWIRFRAIEILGEKNVKDAEGFIIDKLMNDELPVKAACIKTLGSIGSKNSLYVLKGFIDHSDPYLSAAARGALSRISE